jgi:hypothetical protein
MGRIDQPDEEIRRIAWANAPAWAVEAGWDNPDADGSQGTAEQEESEVPLPKIGHPFQDDGRTRRCVKCGEWRTAHQEAEA